MYHKAQVKKQGDVYYKLKTDLMGHLQSNMWAISLAWCFIAITGSRKYSS